VTSGALKDFFRWLSCQPGYKSKVLATDIDHLSLSEKETRAAKEPGFKSFPTIEQVRAVIRQMPAETEVEQRDRALIAMTILTGARDSALASLRLKHIDLDCKLVVQDPREVMTKRSKRIDAYFFPVGDDFEAIVVDWIRYLREEKLYGNDDPVFPRTRVERGPEGAFVAEGLEPVFWQNTAAIRRIFREAFAAAGLAYFRPHSFRDTLVKFGEDHAPTIAHFKAWSQNLGHEQVSTTLNGYGEIAPHRQGELVRSVTAAGSSDDARNRLLFDQFMRMMRNQDKNDRNVTSAVT
jgi:integrase